MEKIKHARPSRRPVSGIRLFLRAVLITLAGLGLVAVGFFTAGVIVGLI